MTPVYSIILSHHADGKWTWAVQVGLRVVGSDITPQPTQFQAVHKAREWIENNLDKMRDVA